jgi:hypothetical protein
MFFSEEKNVLPDAFVADHATSAPINRRAIHPWQY